MKTPEPNEPGAPDNPEIPLADEAESPRAKYQALAERLRAVQPGVSLSDELMAFAEAVTQMARDEQAGRR